MATAAETKGHFSLETIRLLAERAGQRCSLCNCGTSGPHTDSTKSLIIGEAAHIEAEAARGPRPNPKKTKEEFHDAENGIWLCRNCHKRVDRDFAHFPVERLQQIKQDHEARIHREMGSRGLLVPGKIFAVPHRRNRYFTGREDVLEKIAEQLKTSGTAALGQVAAISGLGGIGKTQTAVEFAYRHKEEYRAVFFVVAETEADLSGGFAAIAKDLGLPQAKERDQHQAVEDTKRWLAAEEGWLLILDNADTPELLNKFVPLSPHGHVLVTSRAPSFAGIGAQTLQLRVPSSEEALTFLLKRTGRSSASDDQRQAAHGITVELGNLPLALEQAGAYIVAQQASFADYLVSYRRRGAELLAKGRVEAGTNHGPVAATWSMNIEQVEKLSPASVDLLRAAAFLAPDAIPDEVFLEGGAEISEALAVAVKIKDPLTMAELAAPLLRFSLIERDAEARTVSIHRLVQDVVKRDFNLVQSPILSGLARALRSTFPWPDFKIWSRCERLLPHILAFQRVAPEDENLAWLLNAVGTYFRDRAQFAKAEPLYHRALAFYEATIDRNVLQVARLLNNLAVLYIDLGRPAEAEARHLRALSIREDLGDPIEIAKSLNNLAELYRMEGRFEEAEPLYRRAMAIMKAEYGEHHPNMAQIYNNLGILCRHQDRFTEAESLLLMSLAIREKELGASDPAVANTLNNLAVLYAANGNLEKALPLFRRSLTIFEAAFGEDHPKVADSLSNLAYLCRQLGRDEEAADYERREEEVMARHQARNPGSFPPED